MFIKKFLPVIFFLGLFAMALPAQARIDIVPQKIVISPRERSAEITIMNMYDEPGTFRMDIVNYRQDEEGRYHNADLTTTPPFDPEQHVRYSPRQFTLPPGGRQKIRISLRKPEDLPDGEYRFHMKTLRFGNPPPETDNEIEGNQQSVSLTMNMGITIPVIVRHGETQVEASLSDIRLIPAAQSESGEPELRTTILREGNRSAMCILKVLWAPEGGNEKEIGFIRNVNLFTDIARRPITMKLQESPQGDGTLRIQLLNEETLEIFDEAILR